MKLRNAVFDLLGAFLLSISVVVFAVNAQFAPGGVTGIAVVLNYLFHAPIGIMTLLINIPIVVFTFKKLGWKFFVLSAKTTIISSIFIDYITIYLPSYRGPRLIAAILSGIFAGVAYSLIFNEGSSTGGTDFIIVAVKQWKPRLSFGLLALIIDGTIIVMSVFVFRDIMSFVYGAVYTVVTSAALDLTTKIIGMCDGGGKADEEQENREG